MDQKTFAQKIFLALLTHLPEINRKTTALTTPIMYMQTAIHFAQCFDWLWTKWSAKKDRSKLTKMFSEGMEGIKD